MIIFVNIYLYNIRNIKSIFNFNIYINSRMTNSFGEIKEGQLEEFYQFEDDFD